MASFHLVRWPARRAPAAMARLPVDRRLLARTPGMVFWRLLGTGRGATTTASADLRRWAVFAVWRDEAALEAFLATSRLAARWAAGAEEVWHVRLLALGGHGRWRGFDVLGAVRPAADPGRAGDRDGPVAVLTRADVRVRAWPLFLPAGGPVDTQLHAADGLLAVAGVGEAPVGRQATFSLWRSGAAVTGFARSGAHRDVVRRTRQERWYGEELFARFRPYASEGTWDGRDPLAGT